MPTPINLDVTAETIAQLQKNGLINNKGIMEVVTRSKNKKFKTFYKVTLNNMKQPEALSKAEEAIALLNKNNQIGLQNAKMLGNIATLSKFSLVLNGLNLFATAAGFAIMYAKLNKMSRQIADLEALYRKREDITTSYEINKVISDHSDMLDARRRQKYYSEEKMRKLVSDEYNALDMLIKIFTGNVSGDQETMLFLMYSMASMLATSLEYYDEQYYFANKDAIGSGDKWHLDHDKWMSIFDTMVSDQFIKKIQDHGMFDIGLNTLETDCFYKSCRGQIKSLKQDVADNQKLIITIDDPDVFAAITAAISEDAKNEIEKALADVGADSKAYTKSVLAAVA